MIFGAAATIHSFDPKRGYSMIRKSYSKTRSSCRVTFDFSPTDNSTTVSLCGEFNEWKPDTNPMTRRKDGRFSTTISLHAGRAYRFKYFLDGERWANDAEADGLVLNEFGTEDSQILV
jgi:1,4-alpha-glucan branching enzyme